MKLPSLPSSKRFGVARGGSGGGGCVADLADAKTPSLPDAAGEGPGDVLAVDRGESGYKIIAGGQPEIVSEEKSIGHDWQDRLHVERVVGHADLVAPASGIGCGVPRGRLALNWPN